MRKPFPWPPRAGAPRAIAPLVSLGVAALLGGVPAAAPNPTRIARAARLEATTTWHVDYACAREPEPSAGLVVNDPDAACAYAARVRARGVHLAYLSVGEIHESLRAFGALSRRGALAGANERWPGAHRVRVDHPAYREDYLRPRLREIRAKGFHGVFLDTLDSVFVGARGEPDRASRAAALVATVRWIRREHPEWIVVPNGGLDVEGLEPYVDAWAIEDVFGGFDWNANDYADTAPERQRAILPPLRARRERGLPVFVLDYARDRDSARRALLKARCRAERFRCAIDAFPMSDD